MSRRQSLIAALAVLFASAILFSAMNVERIAADDARPSAKPVESGPAGSQLLAQRGRGRGPGFGRGQGPAPGPGGPGRQGGPNQNAAFEADHAVFFYLIEHRNVIERAIKNLPTGVETVTESADPNVADKIREHVAAMYVRVEKHQPIHMRDPLFAEIFRHAEKVKIKTEDTPRGIKVIETSDDPYVAKLIQAHAQVVSLFIKNGQAEMRKNHALPPR